MPQDPDDRPYNVYGSKPRGIGARLRGESDQELEQRAQERAERDARSGRGSSSRQRSSSRVRDQAPDYGDDPNAPHVYGSGSGRGRGGSGRQRGPAKPGRFGVLSAGIGGTNISPLRILKWLACACVAWVVLSIVLFFISASQSAGNLPGGKKTLASLSSSGPILTSANNILVLGLDSRPRHGYSSHEGGSNYNENDANTDSIMIWRVGGGTSRKLSIPRDTLVDIPHLGEAKINAAWPVDGPAGTVHAVEKLTGIKINHMVVVDLGNFAKFIDDIGGVTVQTPRICSEISGGVKNGGYTLNLKPGTHHLSGDEALTLARTRENSCNPAYTDLNREAMQQEIMNGIRSQLFSLHTFFHLPWASWDAPKTIQTDMGPIQLMELFIASEIGGSTKPDLLSETGSVYNGEDVLIPNKANIQKQVQKLMTGK
jgi:LCP family protein required for cell wall assembly